MNDRTRRGAAVLDKGIALFLRIVEDGGATPLSTLAARAALPASTAHRIVAAFVRSGLLSRTGPGRYAAGLRLARLGAEADVRLVLARASRPLLQQLARDLSTTVHLGVLEGDMVTYLVKAHGGGPDLLTRETMQLEAYCSGIGKVLLAHLDDPAREAYMAAGPFVALTSSTITRPEDLRPALRVIQAQGFALDEAEFQDDLYCLAAPVRGPDGSVVAALSVSSRAGDVRDLHWLGRLRDCGARIEARLGWRSGAEAELTVAS